MSGLAGRPVVGVTATSNNNENVAEYSNNINLMQTAEDSNKLAA